MKRRISMRSKIISLSVILISLALLIQGGWFFYHYYKAQVSLAYDNMEASVEQMRFSINKAFSDINNSALSLLTSPTMQNWLAGRISFNRNLPGFQENVYAMQEDCKNNNLFDNTFYSYGLSTAFLITQNSEIQLYTYGTPYNSPSFTFEELKVLFKKEADAAVFIPPSQNSKDIFFIKQAQNYNRNDTVFFIFIINQSCFQELFSGLTSDLIVSVTDRNDIVLFSNTPDMVGKVYHRYLEENADRYPGKDTLGYSKQITSAPFHVNLFTSTKSITTPIAVTLLQYVAIMAVLLVAFILIAVWSFSNYTYFIKDMVSNLNEVRNQNYRTRMKIYRETDLNRISFTFNKMTGDFEELNAKVYKNELLLKESEIRLLHSQMNPHFLTNTLTTIGVSALLNNDSEVYQMISSLNVLVTANLTGSLKGDLYTVVEKEYEWIKSYLYIQQLRFQERLSCEINVRDKQILNYYIPRLSVEPIVENAVIHGIENSSNKINHIKMDIYTENGDLFFEVSDNGCGCDFDPLKTSSGDDSGRQHIGISNIVERIHLLFGDSYGLEFHSSSGIGTTVIIKLPVLKDRPDQDSKTLENEREE